MIYGNQFLREDYGYCNITAAEVNKYLQEINNISILESDCSVDFLFESTLDKKIDIKSKSKPVADKISKTIKEKGITEESKKTIKKYYEEFITDLTEDINLDIEDLCEFINYKPEEGKYDLSKLAKAGNLFIRVWIVSNVIVQILLLLIKFPNIVTILNSVIVAPIIEETAKAVAVKGGYSTEFLIIFNTYETINYTTKLKAKITDRLKPIAMHCVTTIIQYLTTNKEIQKKLKMDGEKDKEKLTFIGRVIGILIHLIWNGTACILGFKSVMKNTGYNFKQVLFAKNI